MRIVVPGLSIFRHGIALAYFELCAMRLAAVAVKLKGWLPMNYASFLLLALCASSTALAEQPRLVHESSVSIPPEACFNRSGACGDVRTSFVVLPSGKTSDILIETSSGNRACDQAAKIAVSTRVYAPVKNPIPVTEHIIPYSCSASGK